MTDESPQHKPYVSPEQNIREVTFESFLIGIVLAVVMGAANVYLGLKAGMTVSASIPAAVISMAILQGILRRGTILENNIAQTIASTGESLAAGIIFTVPALILVGTWQNFEYWPTTLIALCGGLLGIVFMVPLRRALIVERQDLAYPEGVACAEVLVTGQTGGSGVRWIGLGLAIAAVFKYLVSAHAIIRSTVEGAVAAGKSVFYVGADMSAALLAVGYIVKLRIAAQVFAGGVIGWVIAIPIIGGYEQGPAAEAAWDIWSSQVRYIGVGTMLVGGLYSIWSVRHGILGAMRSLRGVSGGAAQAIRTERDLSMMALATVFFMTVVAMFFLYEFLIGKHALAAIATLMMIVAAFVFSAVATYIAGLVGSSNSPVSGMTICALLMTAAVLLVFGMKGDSAILATLGVAGVVCCAAAIAGDTAQDLKTGHLVGATPARQQAMEMVGVVVPAFFFAPILTLLHKAEGIGEGLLAPQASLFASLAKGIFLEGDLPLNMIYIGMGIGVAIIILNFALEKSGSEFRAYVMPVAVGIYLPMAVSVPIFIGGLLRYLFSKPAGGLAKEGSDPGILFGSGLIAGEALMGIGLAVPVALSFEFYKFQIESVLPSLAAFAALIAFFAWTARKSTAN